MSEAFELHDLRNPVHMHLPAANLRIYKNPNEQTHHSENKTFHGYVSNGIEMFPQQPFIQPSSKSHILKHVHLDPTLINVHQMRQEEKVVH